MFELTPNKPRRQTAHSTQQFHDELDRLKFDPLTEAVKMFRDPNVENRERVVLLREIMRYTYLPRKAKEEPTQKIEQNNTLNVTWNNSPTMDAETVPDPENPLE